MKGIIGKTRLEFAVEGCEILFDKKIDALERRLVLAFYTSPGFIADGEVYNEDGTEHIEMVRPSFS
ncbi:putative GNAT family N-acyltransferase [Flavobacterium sp. W4I14]|nr:putative GNAT family N-acyltransferase [Flavobacterium sp. W4I14]